jgi:dihydroneopterin triphosphate diphosphatase
MRTAQVEIIIYKIISGEVLFLLLKRNEQKGGFWQPITGGVNEGEDILLAVNRELLEETSINEYLRIINNVHYFEFDTEEYGILKEFVFGIEIKDNIKIKLSSEHTEMRWCSLDESLTLLKYENNKTAFKNLIKLI